MAEGIEGLDVAPNDVRVEPVIRLRLKVVFDCLRWDPSIAGDPNVFDAIRIRSLQRLWPDTGEKQSQQH